MNHILVSVLLPTRNRVELVERSVQSLLSNSQDPTRIEIVTAYDDDDQVSAKYFQSLEWRTLVKQFGAHEQALQCPKWGYRRLNYYYTAAAKQAQGQWLMIWNDDAVMRTLGWDHHVAEHKDFVGMLHMRTENFKPMLTLFPLIPKLWIDLFGEISQHQLNDSWIQDICHEAGAVQEIPVTVFHDRYDVTGNNLDATYENRIYDKKIYRHEDTQKIRSAWALRLKEYREQTVSCEPMLPPI
jgi:glycosyltransferase involved in cell wall biosynthesis